MGLEGDLEVDLEGDSRWDIRVDFKQYMEGDLLSSSGQVHDWFRLLLKFNSLELDYEVRRLVLFLSQFLPPSKEKLRFNVCGLWIIIFMFSQSFLGQNIFLMNI